MLGAGGTEKGGNKEEVDGKDKVKDKGEDTKGNKVYNKFIFNQIQNYMLLQLPIICQTLIKFTIIVRGANMAYPHSCPENWSFSSL